MKKQTRFNLVDIDMGYGHRRASYPFISEIEHRIVANNYAGMPMKDQVLWQWIYGFYNKISQLNDLPIIGRYLFGAFDKFQTVDPDSSSPTMQLRFLSGLIRLGWGKDMVKRLSAHGDIPVFTTFFLAAYMLEIHKYPGAIYCLGTDTSISRAWARVRPEKSRIQYFAPTTNVYSCLKKYGVPESHITLTGFPYPKSITCSDAALQRRMNRLSYGLHKKNKPIQILYSVGGAGAQTRVLREIVAAHKHLVKKGLVQFHFVFGTHRKKAKAFKKMVSTIAPDIAVGGISIYSYAKKDDYFKKFSGIYNKADVLWTKPSELSFYALTGIPLLLTAPIGSQEVFNRRWLLSHGFAIEYAENFSSHTLEEMITTHRFVRLLTNIDQYRKSHPEMIHAKERIASLIR